MSHFKITSTNLAAANSNLILAVPFNAAIAQQTTQPQKKKKTTRKHVARKSQPRRIAPSSTTSIADLRQADEQRLKAKKGMGDLRQMEEENARSKVMTMADLRMRDDAAKNIDTSVAETLGKLPQRLSTDDVSKLTDRLGNAYYLSKEQFPDMETSFSRGDNMSVKYYISYDAYKAIVLNRTTSK